MTRISELEDSVRSWLRKADDLATAVKAHGGSFTPEEADEAENIKANVSQEVRRLSEARDKAGIMNQIKELGDLIGEGGPPGAGTSYGSDGSLFGSEGRVGYGSKARDKQWGDPFVQRFGSAKGLTVSAGSLFVPSPVLPVVRDGEPPRYVADLIPVPSQLTTGSVHYLRQTSATNNAAPVVAGASKPESNYALEGKEAPAETIAHVVDNVHRQDLADAPALSTFIEAEMRLGLRIAVDNQILNGTGTTPQLHGILPDTGIQDQTFSTDLFTTFRKARTKLELVYYSDNLSVVLNPSDAETLDLLKDTNGRFYFAGPTQAFGSEVWSATAVMTPAIAQGTALLGSFTMGAEMWPREDARIDFTDALGFKSNLITFRAEQRLAVGVTRPKAFCKVHLS